MKKGNQRGIHELLIGKTRTRKKRRRSRVGEEGEEYVSRKGEEGNGKGVER